MHFLPNLTVYVAEHAVMNKAKIATVDLLSSDKEFESLRNRTDGLCWHEGVGTAAVKGELYYLAP